MSEELDRISITKLLTLKQPLNIGYCLNPNKKNVFPCINVKKVEFLYNNSLFLIAFPSKRVYFLQHKKCFSIHFLIQIEVI